MNNLLNKIIGYKDESTLERRFLIIASVMGMLGAFLASFMNWLLGLGIYTVIIPLFMGVMAYYVYRSVAIKNRYEYSAYSVIIVLILLMYPLMWIFNGGINGSIAYFFIFNSGMAAVLLNQIKYKLILSLQFIIMVSLLVVEYNYPDIILCYNSKLSRFLDIGFSLVLMCILVFVMISKIMKEYHNTIDELVQTHTKLESLNKKLHLTSITDDLTGIFNRRHIMNCLKEKIDKQTPDENISVIMIDIDYFKEINDKYGHGVGDDVICVVSNKLGANIGKKDIIARIGGEEFLVLLFDDNLIEAKEKAEKLRLIVSEIKWQHENMVLTISAGVYCRKPFETIDNVLDQVDLLLYKAKDSGRNIICS